MDAKQVKTVKKLIFSFFLFLVLKVVEELYVIPQKHVDTMGLISCLGGLLILFVYIRMDNKPLEVIGMLFSKHKFGKGLGIAAVVNAVSALIVYTISYFKFTGLGVNLSIYYDSTDNAYSAIGMRGFLLWAVGGLVISLLHAFFYEMAFRGLLLTIAARSFPFGTVNFLQALLYTVWYLFPVLRVLVYSGGAYLKKQLIILVIFTLVYETLTAVRLGMLRRATGSIWVCIFDHLMFTYLFDMVHIQHDGDGLSMDYTNFVIMLGYQVLAMVLTVIYYKKKMKKITDSQRTEFLKSQEA